ncbi:hypothetical protein Tco_0345960, partial [Tanacetum coccineum]
KLDSGISGRSLLFAMGTSRRFTIERLLTFLLGPMRCLGAIDEMYSEDLLCLPVLEEEGLQMEKDVPETSWLLLADPVASKHHFKQLFCKT